MPTFVWSAENLSHASAIRWKTIKTTKTVRIINKNFNNYNNLARVA